MSNYAWRITHDHLEDKPIDVSGPRNATADLFARLGAGRGEAFRIYDDDGELYFSGLIVHRDRTLDHNTAEDTAAFGPLWDYGTPDSGATEIKYLEGGRWVTL